ncbi:hypothetical protein LSH36_812g00036 [Paralvinella palmiformis]|uniref:Uncharacterized protein n=1 Tax=Paralvinella palmiformis TaxID=53620 RepID=A0AAD9J0H2_9ANNE|nr:hypothetical protein LSH36_812g00036 [Paralvinella palmiformis]
MIKDTLPGKVDCTNVTIALWVVSSLLLASVVANIVMLVLSRHQLKPGSSSQKTGPPRNDQDNDQIEPNYNSLRSRDPVLPSVYEGLYVT